MLLIDNFILFTYGAEAYNFLRGLDDDVIEVLENWAEGVKKTPENIRKEVKKMGEAAVEVGELVDDAAGSVGDTIISTIF